MVITILQYISSVNIRVIHCMYDACLLKNRICVYGIRLFYVSLPWWIDPLFIPSLYVQLTNAYGLHTFTRIQRKRFRRTFTEMNQIAKWNELIWLKIHTHLSNGCLSHMHINFLELHSVTPPMMLIFERNHLVFEP